MYRLAKFYFKKIVIFEKYCCFDRKNRNEIVTINLILSYRLNTYLKQSWNRLGNGKPVRSGRLKILLDRSEQETGQLESYLQPVKFL